MQGALLSTLVILVEQGHISPFGLQAQGTSGFVTAVIIVCAALSAFAVGRAIDAMTYRSTLVYPFSKTGGGYFGQRAHQGRRTSSPPRGKPHAGD